MDKAVARIIFLLAVSLPPFLCEASDAEHLRFSVFKNKFVDVYFPKESPHPKEYFKSSSRKSKLASKLAELMGEIPEPFLVHFESKRLQIYIIPRTQDNFLEPSSIYWCEGTLGFATPKGIFLREALLWNVAGNLEAIRLLFFHEIAHVLEKDGVLSRSWELAKMDKEVFADATALFWNELLKGRDRVSNLADYHDRVLAFVSSSSLEEENLNKIGNEIVNRALTVEEPPNSPTARKKTFLLQASPIDPEWYGGFDLLIEVMFSDGESRFYLGQKEKRAFQRLSMEADRAFVHKWLKASWVKDTEGLEITIIEVRNYLAYELGVKPWLIFPIAYSPSDAGGSLTLACTISRTYTEFPKLKFKYAFKEKSFVPEIL